MAIASEKPPKKVGWFGSESTEKEEEEGWRNLRPMSCIYLFPYLSHIHVQCQAQFSMHPQTHIPVIHLRPRAPGRQDKASVRSLYSVQELPHDERKSTGFCLLSKSERGYSEIELVGERLSKQK